MPAPRERASGCLRAGLLDDSNQSSVGVLVERTSRLVLLAKMAGTTSASALAGFSAKLNSIAEPMRQSLTYDQGKELSRDKELTARTGVAVYFYDPHNPWKRSFCENTNGCCGSTCPRARTSVASVKTILTASPTA